jgi:LacI family transcriptional regulator
MVVMLRRQCIPVVSVDRASDDAPYCSVAVDDVAGGRLAVDHFVAQGHRNIAFVGGPMTIHQVRVVIWCTGVPDEISLIGYDDID